MIIQLFLALFPNCSVTFHLACSRRSYRGDGAKRCEQKKKQRGDGVGVRARECLSDFLTKASSSIPDSGIPYDWSILTALVSTKRFIELTHQVRDGPLENLWGGGGGRAKYKKNSSKGKLKEKNSCTPINPKKYSCYGLKKVHTRKKIPAARKFPYPPPPITFLMVCPLS